MSRVKSYLAYNIIKNLVVISFRIEYGLKKRERENTKIGIEWKKNQRKDSVVVFCYVRNFTSMGH